MQTHTTQEWASLCEKVKQLVPKEISQETWILITAATLATSPSTELMANFYTYLTKNDPTFHSKESRQKLSLQFRDILLKLITLVGAPRVLCNLTPLAQAEGNVEQESANSVLNDKWKPENMDVQAIFDRGRKTINAIYGPSLLEKVFATWGSHKEDVRFNELFAIYGLYLSDFDVMSPLEAEAVVYAMISCLGLGGPGNWHLRGMGRMLGARGTDQNSLQAHKIRDQLNSLREAVQTVVKFVGTDFIHNAKLEEWATVENMVAEFERWGNDE